MTKRRSLAIPAIVAAATVGDGVFALPYVFKESGWLVSVFFLVALGIIVSVAHVVYLKTLEQREEKQRLLELAETYFGRGGFWTAFISIIVGLLLTLVAYLILGTQFIHLAFPGLSEGASFAIFWLIVSLTVLLSDGRVVELELIGIACTAAIIFFIFGSAWPHVTFAGVPAASVSDFFLPFSVILFSLAGWTSVEPAYEYRKRSGLIADPWKPLVLGTMFVVLLYLMFAAGVIGSAPNITPDTVSGLVGWPLWKKEILAIFGFIAIATIYLPISREVKNALEKDLRWNRIGTRALIILLPPALIWLGFRNFLFVVSFTGGVFLSIQYLLIVSVGRKALELSRAKNALLGLSALAFIAAAVYEIFAFVVH